MPTDTKGVETVTLERNARLLRESLTRCRRDVSSPIQDQHIANLLKRLDNDRIKPCEHIVEVQWDAFSRSAPREAVEGFWYAGLAMVGSWYEANAPRRDLKTLIREEAEVRGSIGVTEVDLLTLASPKVIADAAAIIHRELTVLRSIADECDRTQFGSTRQTPRVA